MSDPEFVWVPRSGPGFRPVPYLAFGDRTVFSALVNLVGTALADDASRLGLRSLNEKEDEPRSDFERQPLDESGAPFVVLADVASCYEYVDHQLLAKDIVELTADIESAEALNGFLTRLMGREFGLPQGPRPSDVMAEIYLSTVDQELRRAGAEIWRSNDDYLLGASSGREALLLLRDLEAGLRRRGLVLNHQKSRIVERETYRMWVDALAAAIEEAQIDDAATSFYTFDPDAFIEADLEGADLGLIEALFRKVLYGDEQGPYREGDRLLQRTLPLLAAGESLLPLRHLKRLTRDWSLHTRHISLYLRELIRTHPDDVSSSIGLVLNSKVAETVPWVRGWLLDPLARSDVALKPKALTARCENWFLSENESWFVRGRCAIVLAQRGIIPKQNRFSEVFERAPVSAKADLVAAVRIAEPIWSDEWLNATRTRHPLLRRIVNWDEPDWFVVL